MVCPACGNELPGEFPFCPHCGTALAAAAKVQGSRERKVVSVLFCDLVGFTAASESSDPEEVQARVAPYHRTVRDRIEVFGGTVEKFIGDAVMAVFGAPVAREDDPERAVRAGLAILGALRDLNESDPALGLSVRVGVNTGEAVVTLDARPEAGEGMVTGDVVNTAARIQAQAPVDGVAVGEGTYRATERVFEYDLLEPIVAKGKALPVPVWHAIAPRARFGSDVIRTIATPLVGRHADLALLRGTFDKVLAERSVQLVTVVGEPGVGKSRLVAELFAYIDALPTVVIWRQGRCLPYGEGITFWALGEILKAHAGVFESDSPEVAAMKLDQVIPADADTAWLRARLLPLLGLDAGTGVAREDSPFPAWRRFLEAIAERGPTVLVFEDVHWADEALLAFLEHLADWASDVPLLVVCTARPELYDRAPTWGAGLRKVTTIGLAPLSPEDTARLVSALLEQAVLPAETQQLLLDRAGGNPLYAEEFVRMLSDRELLDEHGRLAVDGDISFPDSLQALIAARLDTLAADRKALLQAAAVIGKVFWSGAVASVAERSEADVAQALHELARKELVRPARRSSMEGEQEYGFWHALVRDVAYGQIPRGERAAKHVQVVEWLEAKAGDRVDDLAEVLAHHTAEAIDLATVTGDTALAAELADRARRYALRAGERALLLDTARARQLLERALELTPEQDDAYAGVLRSWSQATFQAGDVTSAGVAYERVAKLFRERGDVEGAAGVLGSLSTIRYYQGDPRAIATAEEAVELLEAVPGEALVDALAELAGSYLVVDHYREALDAAERALSLAATLGLPVPLRALSFGGSARAALGDERGLGELERAAALMRSQGAGREAVVAANNHASLVYEIEGPDAFVNAMADVRALAEARGVFVPHVLAETQFALVEIGRLHHVIEGCDEIIAALEANGIRNRVSYAEAALVYALYEAAEYAEASARTERMLASVPEGLAGRLLWEVHVSGSLGRAAVGDRPGARDLLELVVAGQPLIGPDAASRLPLTTRCALLVGDIDLAERLCLGVEPRYRMHVAGLTAARAQIDEARGAPEIAEGGFTAAAEQWEALGAPLERAYALLGAARCHTPSGLTDALVALGEARTLFASMGANRGVVACDALVAGRECRPRVTSPGRRLRGRRPQTPESTPSTNASASASIRMGSNVCDTGPGVFRPSPVTSRTTRERSLSSPASTAARRAPSVTPVAVSPKTPVVPARSAMFSPISSSATA